jgi:hypothetical protein
MLIYSIQYHKERPNKSDYQNILQISTYILACAL